MRFRWSWLVGAACVVCCVVLAWLPGRGRSDSAMLLNVSGVEPKIVERGDSLMVSGTGFPAGRTAEVTLRGVLHRAAARPVEVRTTLSGLATRADRVEVALDDASVARLGGAGSFDGTLEVSFSALHGGGRVTGSAPAALDFMGSHRELRLRAEDLLARTGIELEDVDMLHGLRIARIQPGSLAERSGLHAGDTIVSAADVRVHALADIAPATSLGTLPLQVIRVSSPAPVMIALQLTATDEITVYSPRVLRLGALFCFLLVVLMFASPMPSPTPLVVRALRELEAKRTRGAGRSLAEAALALLPVSLVALLFASQWPIDVFVVSACMLIGSAVFAAASLRASPATLRSFLGHAAVLVAVLACACMSSGTRELAGIVAQQSVAPFTWKLFTHPELGLGFGLFMVHAAKLLPPSAAGTPRVLALARTFLLGMWSLLAACVFLGGYRVHADAAELSRAFDTFWLGGAWLTAKTIAVVALLGLAERVAAPLPSRPRLRVSALAFVVVGSVISTLLAPSRATELEIGAVLGSTLVVALALAWIEAKLSLRKAPAQPAAARY